MGAEPMTTVELLRKDNASLRKDYFERVTELKKVRAERDSLVKGQIDRTQRANVQWEIEHDRAVAAERALVEIKEAGLQLVAHVACPCDFDEPHPYDSKSCYEKVLKEKLRALLLAEEEK